MIKTAEMKNCNCGDNCALAPDTKCVPHDNAGFLMEAVGEEEQNVQYIMPHDQIQANNGHACRYQRGERLKAHKRDNIGLMTATTITHKSLSKAARMLLCIQ